MTWLKRLEVTGDAVSEDGLAGLSRVSDLEWLKIRSGTLRGDFIASHPKLQNLKLLWVRGPVATDTDVKSLSKLRNL
jgi:hypothetical protein